MNSSLPKYGRHWTLENDSKAFSSEFTTYWLSDRDPTHVCKKILWNCTSGTPSRDSTKVLSHQDQGNRLHAPLGTGTWVGPQQKRNMPMIPSPFSGKGISLLAYFTEHTATQESPIWSSLGGEYCQAPAAYLPHTYTILYFQKIQSLILLYMLVHSKDYINIFTSLLTLKTRPLCGEYRRASAEAERPNRNM